MVTALGTLQLFHPQCPGPTPVVEHILSTIHIQCLFRERTWLGEGGLATRHVGGAWMGKGHLVCELLEGVECVLLVSMSPGLSWWPDAK